MVVSIWEEEVVVLWWKCWIGRLWQRLEVRASWLIPSLSRLSRCHDLFLTSSDVDVPILTYRVFQSSLFGLIGDCSCDDLVLWLGC